MRNLLILFMGACSSPSHSGPAAPDLAPAFSMDLPTAPNPLVSRGVPAFSSDGADATGADDDRFDTAWSPKSLPASLIYDLSSLPARGPVLVSWYAIHAPCYIDTGSSGQRPLAYALEANRAPGGTPPSDGWTTLISVPDNRYCGRMHLVDLAGANWLRMRIDSGTSDGVALELDVQAAPSGASDAWLFMGDSITYMTMTHAFCDLPELVHAQKPGYFPAVIDAAIGGTNTSTALPVIDDTMRDFPGRFVVLAYGTNDHAGDFHMEELVQKVLAAGKTPVVPHMPWSSGSTEGPAINQQIDALYAKYPELVPGPDLWAFFDGHTEWIPSGDVHPNAAGQEALRGEWAKTLLGLDR